MEAPPLAETVSAREIGGFRRSRGVDAEIGELARRQHGLVGRRQLLALGIGEDAIDHRLAVGRLYRVQDGVYSVGHRLITKHGWWLAAVLASGSKAVLSHHSAAALWGLRSYTERAVEVTTPSKSTSSKLVRRHRKPLPPDEVTVMEGIPVTSVPRTIFDLAATEPLDVVKALLREAEFRGLMTGSRSGTWSDGTRGVVASAR